MRSAMRKTILREIKNSLSRYLAILAIVTLGVGFFAGLKVTKPAMLETVGIFLSEHDFFDYRLLSTLGFAKKDAAAIADTPGVKRAEGAISQDVLCIAGDGSEMVLKAHSLTENVNTLSLICGRLPLAPNECVGDAQLFTTDNIGQPVVLSQDNNSETLEMFAHKTYVLVGIAHSPTYLNFERGTSVIGNGRVLGFFYLAEKGFKNDYYTEINLTLEQTGPIYSEEYNQAAADIEEALMSVAEERANLRHQQIVVEAERELLEAQSAYEEARAVFLRKRNTAQAELANILAELTTAQEQIAQGEVELKENEEKLLAARAEARQAMEALENKQANPLYATPEAQPQLEVAIAQLEQQLTQIEGGLAKIAENERELQHRKAEISSGWASYNQAKEEAEEQFAQGEEELTEAEEKINAATADVKNIPIPRVYALNRETNVGYVSFANDSEIVEGISTLFPVFFFLIAALVCSTTMTRMVDDQRTQIGVLKSIGYSKWAVMSKYLFYAGSAALIGCVLGFLGGTIIFPKVIWKAYEIMYNFADIVYIFDLNLAIISLIVSLLCTIGVTWLTSYMEFTHAPAELIRPKSPQAGKRIFLESLPFIWRKLKFLHKISARNILRYKKRLLMMILGIGGCTALLLTGFGIRDSVKNVVADQYDEIILYDYVITFNQDLDDKVMAGFQAETNDYIEEMVFVHESMGEILLGDRRKSVSVIAAQENSLQSFVSLHTEKGTVIPYPALHEAVLNTKMAKELDLKIGDRFTLSIGEDILKLTVSGINENYVGNYVYISWATCLNQLGTIPEIKTAYLNASENSNLHEIATELINLADVNRVTINADLRERIANMMTSMDYIVLLVIFCAGTLVFIVLYNLTNINISERLREIATLKVLGFYPRETADYVFRENIVLTVLGVIIGILPGRLMHSFVMDQIQIEVVSFNVRIAWSSYLMSIALTFCFAWLVNLVMRRKIHHINMAESMKSVE